MIPVEVSLSVRKDRGGNFIGFFVAISDISEIKKYQQNLEEKVKERTRELEESKIALMNILDDMEKSRKALLNILEDVEEEKKRTEEEKIKTLAIINNLTDALLVFDKENKLSLFNPQAEKFLNIKLGELIGHDLLSLNNYLEFKNLINVLGTDKIKKIFRKEIALTEKLILEVSTAPIILKEGEIFGNLVILHDVTREKMVEQMKTEFVSLSAHQLRTPLSAIKWTLKSLLDGDLGQITPEQREFVEKTYISNERMIALINDLLNVTRIEEGRYLYKLINISLETVIQNLINSYQDTIKRKNIVLEFKKPLTPLPLILVDEEKIKLVIQNLLDNALTYTPAGGRVTISLNCDKKEIEFSIKDTGIGIPADQQARVFSKFFRAVNATRVDTEGTGLGLFIAKNIIEAHGGRIWFFSKEGYGTTFYFTLPLERRV